MKVKTFADCEKAVIKIFGFHKPGVADEIAKLNGIEHPNSTKLKSAKTNADRWAIVAKADNGCQWGIRNKALLEIVRGANAGSKESWQAYAYSDSNIDLADRLLMAMLEKKNTGDEIHKILTASEKYAGEMKSEKEALRQLCEIA